MDIKKLDGESYNTIRERINELKRMFPEAVNEGRLDYDMFMALLGDEFDNDQEKYRFEWKGKLDSLKLAQKRSSGTLRPDFEGSKDWETTGNLYIEGDNLEVLKLLQQGYLRKVKMIYIDPPYNTGNDFVYADDFADPIARYKEATEQGMRANPETAGRYHSNWLNMMYPRLKIAKTLLRDDGVIFISIDDNEVHNLRKVCDEVFGEDNFLGDFIWKSRQIVDSRNKTGFSNDHEFILVYCRRIEEFALAGKAIDTNKYSNPDNDPRGPWMSNTILGLANAAQRPNLHYPIVNPQTGIEYPCNPDTGWRFSKETMAKKIDEGRILFPKDPGGRPREKKFLDELGNKTTGVSSILPEAVGFTMHGTKEVTNIFDDKYFDFPKPVGLIKSFISQGTDVDDVDTVILDFFSGSATTAHAVMQLNAEDGGNRKFIMVQIPEPTDENSEAAKAGYATIAEIGKERIRRAGDKILKEWNEKQTGQVSLDGGNEQQTPPDIGFRVFKLDTSNIKKWDDSYIDPAQMELFFERLEESIDSIRPDRRMIDVVYEIFLKYGISLTEKLSTVEIGGKQFYVVGENGYLFICLMPGITFEIAEEAASYAPGTMIFAEHCFADSNVITNIGLMLDKAQIEMRMV